MEHTASPPDAGTAKHPGFFAALELRLLDAIIGFFQYLRNHVAPPVIVEEPSRSGRKRDAAHAPVAAPVAVPAAVVPTPGRRRSVLLHLMFLVLGVLVGMTFSYHMLAKVIDGNEMIVDYLREDIAQMNKEEARNINARTKLQLQVAEDNKEMREFRAVIAQYKDLVEDLRQQLEVAKAANTVSLARDRIVYPAGSTRRTPATSAKTGTCVMGPGNSTSLADCVEEFNRK